MEGGVPKQTWEEIGASFSAPCDWLNADCVGPRAIQGEKHTMPKNNIFAMPFTEAVML